VQMGVPDGGGQMSVAHGVKLVVQGERVALTGAE